MSFSIEVIFDDDTKLTTGYRLKDLMDVIKKSPLYEKRCIMPVIPWLIDLGIDYVGSGSHNKSIKRINIEEKVVI